MMLRCLHALEFSLIPKLGDGDAHDEGGQCVATAAPQGLDLPSFRHPSRKRKKKIELGNCRLWLRGCIKGRGGYLTLRPKICMHAKTNVNMNFAELFMCFVSLCSVAS